MVKSLNTEMAHTTKGTWFREGPIYGNIMVGDKAFEFYNDTKLQDYVQIPWDEITYVIADIYFGGKFIPRFEIRTKQNGRFRFASRKSRITLKKIQKEFLEKVYEKHLALSLSSNKALKIFSDSLSRRNNLRIL